VFVTGTSGLIGQEVVVDLVARGWGVMALDSAPPAHPVVGVETVVKDIREVTGADLEGVDAVIHLAALTLSAENEKYGQTSTPRTAEAMLGVNVTGTDAVFRAAVEAGVPAVVYASAGGLYGGPEWHHDPGGGVSRKGPFRPPSLYAHTKLLNEGMADFYGAAYDTRFVGIRPTFSYGLGRLVGISGMFAQWIVDAVEGREARLPAPFGRSGQLQLIYATDMARTFAQCAEVAIEGRGFGEGNSLVFNSPTSQLLSMTEIARQLRERSGNDQVSVVEEHFSPQIQMPVMETQSIIDFLNFDQQFPFEAAIDDIAGTLRPGAARVAAR
jgi:nucleoside-diphosphate-sugar epimerase